MLDLLNLADAGRLRPVVGGACPFAEAAAAHAKIKARLPLGKVVLVP